MSFKLPKTSENFWFFYAFRGCRKTSKASDGSQKTFAKLTVKRKL